MELTIEQALQQGLAAHRAGKLQEAELLYRAILQSQPLHPDANHNLGVLAVSVNQVEAALPLFKTSLEANSKIEQFWLSYIDALIKNKQLDNAKQVIEQAKKQGVEGEKLNSLKAQLASINEPKNVSRLSPSQEQLSNLSDDYQAGRFDEAEKLAVYVTQEFPNHPFAWKVLSGVLKQNGRVNESLVASQKALQLVPEDAEAHSNLGNTLKKLGRLEEAEASLRRATALKPDFVEAHNNLGNTLQELGRLDEAEASLRQAITLKSDYVEAHNNLGNTLQELGRLDEAEASYTQAIVLKPDLAEAHNNLGNTLQALGRLDEAETSLRQAIALKPDYAEAYSSLGNTLQELGRLVEAEAILRQAIGIRPDYAEALHNLSIVQSYMNNLEGEVVSLQNILQIDADNYGLRAGVNLAICNFLKGDFADSKKHLMAAHKLQEKLSSEFKNEKVYQKYLLNILNWHEEKYFTACNRKTDKTLYVIGESHSLVSHQLHAQSSDSVMLCKGKLIKGCKQWYLGNSNKNKYKHQFESIFCSLPESSEVLLAIGEIDCRLDSGIIKHKNKFPGKELTEIIVTTIENYLTYILKNNSVHQHNIIIQGVPCPNIDTENHPENEVTQLIEVTRKFDCELKNKSKEKGFAFLDLHKLTDRGDGFSNAIWHIDDIHLSPDGMLEAWRRYASEQKTGVVFQKVCTNWL